MSHGVIEEPRSPAPAGRGLRSLLRFIRANTGFCYDLIPIWQLFKFCAFKVSIFSKRRLSHCQGQEIETDPADEEHRTHLSVFNPGTTASILHHTHAIKYKKAMDFLAIFNKQSKPVILIVGFTIIGVIGGIDFMTGYEYSFSAFYVLPISLVTWFTSRGNGLVASFASAAVWFSADIATGHSYSHSLIPVWNTVIRFAFFVIITMLLAALKSALQRESELARKDFLTGAINSRFFYELAKMEVDRLKRYQHPFTLAYIDLDNFKSVNDRFGHSTGDQVLRKVVSSVIKNLRKTDVFARLGGDEFALLFPETDRESASVVINKIRGALIEEMQEQNWPITSSIGVLTCSVAPNTIDDLVKMTDELMYSVKLAGKNAVKYSNYEG